MSRVLTDDTVPGVRATLLYAKTLRGEPMVEKKALKLCPERGVIGDVNAERSPRQLTMAFTDSLIECGVTPAGARANLILELLRPGADQIAPGVVLVGGEVAIRVTMVCEPCKHGADLAEVPNRRFRRIRRYLGIVLHGGAVEEGTDFAVHPGIYSASPDMFAERTAWALDHIPSGQYVPSIRFLNAIGAGKAYARALSGWLRKAADSGRAVHRVLAAGSVAGSWEPRSIELLAAEKTGDTVPEFDLMTALWFQEESAPYKPGHPMSRPSRHRNGVSFLNP